MKNIVLKLLCITLVLASIFIVSCKQPENPPVIDPADEDGKFSIAILPDTQQEVVIQEAIKNRLFAQRNEWLVSKMDERDIRFALHTGDVVNWGDVDESQLVIASDAMEVLDKAGIPVVYALGNHDTAAVGVGGSAAVPSETKTRVRDTSAFNKYFSTTRYPYLNVREENHIENAYALFEACGVKWMVLTLELWPRTEVIEWAKSVVSQHPRYNVIVITHSYLTANGDILTTNGGYGANSPEYLYNNLISCYDNIKMVFSGHTGSATARVNTTKNGNKIINVLGCFHSNDNNPVRLVEIDVKNGTVEGEIFVPISDKKWTQYCFYVDGMNFINPE